MLSSDTLFHYTSSLDILKSILKNGFIPKYCVEFGWKSRLYRHYYVSMVSFCDIPLSQVKLHIEMYGNYGIGVTKEWARRNAVSPVSYLTNEFFKKFKKRIVADSVILSRIKPEIGISRNKITGVKINNYRYYDEKEWRYVPYDEDYYVDENRLNGALQAKRFGALSITPSDIRYIIVNDDSELLEMCKHIDAIWGASTSVCQNDIIKLKTRILTIDQIKNDF